MGSLDAKGESRILPEVDDRDEEIIVSETVVEKRYPWPPDVELGCHGIPNSKPNSAYKFSLKVISRVRPDLSFITLYKDETGRNAIERLPSLFNILNQLFRDQLSSDFSEVQASLLYEADVVLICYDPIADTILSYGSTLFSKRGTVPGVPYQVAHAGHMIVAKGHERKQLAPLHGVTMALYGHTFRDLFRTEILVMRTNNRYMEGLFGVVPTLYRSDHLKEDESDQKLNYVIEAIKWTDKNVFHSDHDLILGAPITVTHRFDERVTIDGLKTNEIIYLARISSIGIFLLRVFYGTVGSR